MFYRNLALKLAFPSGPQSVEQANEDIKFSDFKALHPSILEKLDSLGFERPLPVQHRTLSASLKGKYVVTVPFWFHRFGQYRIYIYRIIFYLKHLPQGRGYKVYYRERQDAGVCAAPAQQDWIAVLGGQVPPSGHSGAYT